MNYITIEGFKQLSKQQLFDMSLNHIRSTGKQALNRHGGCTYAGSGCAAAPFLKLEERTTNNPSWNSLAFEHKVPQHEKNFVIRLQHAHDSFERRAGGEQFMAHFENQMEKLAHEHGLEYKKP